MYDLWTGTFEFFTGLPAFAGEFSYYIGNHYLVSHDKEYWEQEETVDFGDFQIEMQKAGADEMNLFAVPLYQWSKNLIFGNEQEQWIAVGNAVGTILLGEGVKKKTNKSPYYYDSEGYLFIEVNGERLSVYNHAVKQMRRRSITNE
ncbi:MAG: hypothetical protein ACE5ES_05700, partial [Candidatus Nanoarchaeia archaeon]